MRKAKKLILKTEVEISVGDKSFNVPIEIDLNDIVDLMPYAGDWFKEAIIDEILGNTPQEKTSKWIKEADCKYIIFNKLTLFRKVKTAKTKYNSEIKGNGLENSGIETK